MTKDLLSSTVVYAVTFLDWIIPSFGHLRMRCAVLPTHIAVQNRSYAFRYLRRQERLLLNMLDRHTPCDNLFSFQV